MNKKTKLKLCQVHCFLRESKGNGKERGRGLSQKLTQSTDSFLLGELHMHKGCLETQTDGHLLTLAVFLLSLVSS